MPMMPKDMPMMLKDVIEKLIQQGCTIYSPDWDFTIHGVGLMKNACNKKEIYFCDARRFDKDHCYFHKYSYVSNCHHKYGNRCTSAEAQKHADGRGSKYPSPWGPRVPDREPDE